MNKQDLILVMQTAFLGEIAENVRAIAFDYTDNTIMLYVYLDGNPNEEDYDVIDAVVTEIMASLPDILYQKIEISENKEPIRNLKNYKGWFFVRKESL
jgi:hypothetical protein